MPTAAPSFSLDALAGHEALDAIDVETARLLGRLGDDTDPLVQQSALLLSAQRRAGAACVRLGAWATRPFPERADLSSDVPPPVADGPPLPPTAEWRDRLDASPLVHRETALRAEDAVPLVLSADGERLYLYRWWRAEQSVARLLRLRADADPAPLPDEVQNAFARFFEARADDEPASGQAVAAAGTLFSPLTVVTGGPGTGKTYAAARLLALLLTARPTLSVALAAPTGKAAKRLGASIAHEADTLDLPDPVRRALPREAQTLHRLLGYRPDENRFRFHAGRPLAGLGVVVVDESSMIDLLLFQSLLEALPDETRLVFLGDEHQLSSIGAGRVLADLAALRGTGRSPAFARHCRRLGAGQVPTAQSGSSPTGPLCDAVTVLQKTYRFSDDSGVAALAGAVRDGKADRAVEVLHSDAFPDARLVSPPGRFGAVLNDTVEQARALCEAPDAAAAFALAKKSQVLAATYHGPRGVHAANAFVTSALRRDGRASGVFYPGRPVLVTANDYALDLFNGDLGVCLSEDGQLHARFETASGGAARAVAPARLPPHESAYAMTVHKSQGSEYDAVTLLLPADMQPPLCRELIYTAVTRAKKRVTVVGPERVLRAAIAAPEQRPSGLEEAVLRAGAS